MINEIIKNKKVNSYIPVLSAVLVLLFMVLITLGAYYKIKKTVVIAFFLISVALLFFLSIKKCLLEFIKSPFMWLWLIYILAGALSTLFVMKSKDIYILITELSFTFILFMLTREIDVAFFFKIYRIFMFLMVILSLVQAFTGITFWRFMKEGTTYQFSDGQMNSLISIFEFRHYFGCYLIFALFSIFFFPEKIKWLNFIYPIFFAVAIVMTFTRSVWLGTIIGLLLLTILLIIKIVRKEVKLNISMSKRGILITVISVVVIFSGFALIFREKLQPIIYMIVLRFNQAQNPLDWSVSNRLYSITHGFLYFKDNFKQYFLFGMGNGAALEWLASNEGIRFTGAIDCQYIQTLIDTGVIGLGALLLTILGAIISLYYNRDKKILLCSVTLIGIAVAFTFFEVLVVNSSVYVLWCFLVMMICRGQLFKRVAKN